MKKVSIWLVFFVVGGIACWGTNSLIEHLGSNSQPTPVIIAKTIFIPLAIWFVYRNLVRLCGWEKELMKSGVAMILGIWFFGPFDIIFLHPQQIKGVMHFKEMLFYIALFPVTTLFVSVYSGALGGVLTSSVFLMLSGMGWLGVPGEKHKPEPGDSDDIRHPE